VRCASDCYLTFAILCVCDCSRDALAVQLSTLECRMSGSEDDVLLADDLDSVVDEVYEATDSDSAITDMSDAQTTPGIYEVVCSVSLPSQSDI
jgi:tryptophanyl-tRNA synthetase